jgi:hypothetical protein
MDFARRVDYLRRLNVNSTMLPIRVTTIHLKVVGVITQNVPNIYHTLRANPWSCVLSGNEENVGGHSYSGQYSLTSESIGVWPGDINMIIQVLHLFLVLER